MNEEDLAYASIQDLRSMYASGEISATEVVNRTLTRIEQLDPEVHAYVWLDAEGVLRAAHLADKAWLAGRPRPLEGIPVALKDVFDFGPTSAGSRVLADNVAAAPSAAVQRLQEAGALILGKTTTYEFAFGRPSIRESLFPPARNPWKLELDPGGSSSGSAVAVAAGLAQAATGTDTSGSVRWPPAYCGVVGLKPTYGTVSRRGVVPLAWSLDHVGVITRTVTDAGMVLEVIAGYDPHDPTSSRRPAPRLTGQLERPVRGLRLGIPEGLFRSSCDPQIAALFDLAIDELRRLGFSLQRVESVSIDQALATTYPLLLAEAASYHAPNLRQILERYSRDLRVFFTSGLLVPAPQYLLCQRSRQHIRASQLDQLKEVDAFVLPTVGLLSGPVPQYPEGLTFLSGEQFANYAMVYNLTGLPAVSVPCGLTPTGLPVGLQFAGRPFDELTVLTVARAYERATGWTEARPPLGGQN